MSVPAQSRSVTAASSGRQPDTLRESHWHAGANYRLPVFALSNTHLWAYNGWFLVRYLMRHTLALTLNIIIRQCLWSSGDDIVLIPIDKGYTHFLSIGDKNIVLKISQSHWKSIQRHLLQLLIKNITVTFSSLVNKIDTSYWTRFCSLQCVTAVLLTQLAGINYLPPWEGEEGCNTLLKSRT